MNKTANCRFCDRLGLSLLPLRIAYAPERSSALGPAITRHSRMPATDLVNGGYLLRVIESGFVYLLDERAGGVWRCFGATPTGHLRELSLDRVPPEVPQFQCQRSGHGAVASLINIENATEAKKVWVGYSRVWLTRTARGKLKSDESLRRLCMLEIDASSLVRGGAVPADAGMRLTSPIELERLAPEFAATAEIFELADKRFAAVSPTAAVCRVGEAPSLIERMQANSPGNAIVLALPDPVGVLREINHWRNLRAGELSGYQAKTKDLQERITGDLILNLRDSLIAQGQASIWSQRYAPKLDEKRLDANKASHVATVKKYEQAILKAAQDWCTWASSTAFKRVWKLYDGADSIDGVACGLAMEAHMAACVFGSGGTPTEHAWWKQWLNAKPDTDESALWLALGAGDKSVMTYAFGDGAKLYDVGKTDKGVDIVKNTLDARQKFIEWLKSRKAQGQQRAVQEASGTLATAVAAQAFLVAKSEPALALVLHRRVRIFVACRMTEVVGPWVQRVTLGQLTVQMHEAIWGPPRTQLASQIAEARRLKLAQSISGAWMGGRFTSTYLVPVDVWVPERLVILDRQGAAPSPVGLPAPGAAAGAVPEAHNLWKGMHEYLKSLKSVPGGLLGLGAALQISNLGNTLIQMRQQFAGNADNRDEAITESIFGVISGSLGLMAVTAEVVAGSMAARVASGAEVAKAVTAAGKAIATRAAFVALGGGVLGVLSASVDAVQAFRKFLSLRAEKDSDASSSYLAVSALSVVAAVAGGAIALIATGAALQGATGVVAGAVVGMGGFLSGGSFLGGIPVIGWILLAVGAIVAGLVFGYLASREEDTALEKWLSRCCWRHEGRYGTSTRLKFQSFKEEMAEFHQAIYGLQLTLEWDDRLGRDKLLVNVVMPGYVAARSEYAYQLELDGQQGPLVVAHKSSKFSADTGLSGQPTKILPRPNLQAMRSKSDIINRKEAFRLEQQKGGAVLVADLFVDDDKFSSARLKFEYWPDAIHQPDLRMTPLAAGANLVLTAD